MRCAECDSVYHVSCWAELDKCGLFGCEAVPDSLSQQTDYTLDLMIGMIILFGPAAYIDIFTDISPRDINSILIVPIIILYGAGSLLLGQLIADRIKNKFPE